VVDPRLDYSTFLGGSRSDGVADVAVDPQGHTYVVGGTSSSDFPTTPGAYDPVLDGASAMVVAKLARDGSSLVYSTLIERLTASGFFSPRGIAVDHSGSVYVLASGVSAALPTTPGAFRTQPSGTSLDGYLLKLDASGSRLLYATYLPSLNEAEDLAVDASGHAYVTGWTTSANVPTTPGAYDPTDNGSYDGYVLKVNRSGTDLVYGTYLGSGDRGDFFEDDDRSFAIAVDERGSAYVTGETKSTEFPTTPGAYAPTIDPRFNIRRQDAFVTKLRPDGSSLAFSTYVGGDDVDEGKGIAVDQKGDVYVTGRTNSPAFPTTPGAFDRTYNGLGPTQHIRDDAFLAKFDASGSSLVYSTYLGGDDIDEGVGVAVDVHGRAYVAGHTRSDPFPTTPDAFDRRLGFGCGQVLFDGFVAQFDAMGSALLYSTLLGGECNDQVGGIALDARNDAYVGGFTPNADFPVTPGAFDTLFGPHSDAGAGDGFVSKLDLIGPGAGRN
jgi:hypothetical protein